MLASKSRPRLRPLQDISSIELRVWPQDLDLNRHVNNGRYLAFMDLGRMDLLFRSGLGQLTMKNKWQPVLTGVNARYRRPLGVFHRFQVDTELCGWTEQSLFMEHRIVATSGPFKGELAASAVVRAVMLKPGTGSEKVRTAELFAPFGPLPESPPLLETCLMLLSPKERQALANQPQGAVVDPIPAGSPEQTAYRRGGE
nr:acyl-CoA thioesterase [Marinicella sp. W31]MDC2876988.1 acyl-CoA thioesterase [Marinicella sp. W31]